MAKILKRLEVGWGKVEHKTEKHNISVTCKDRGAPIGTLFEMVPSPITYAPFP